MADVDPSGIRGEPDDERVEPSPARGAADEGVHASLWEHAATHFARWRSGDSRAMDELVRAMSPVLWHVVRSYGLDRGLSEDVVQTTWLTFVRTHETIHDERAVAGWLTTCARREAWRVGKAQRRADVTDAADLEPRIPAQESAEHTAQLAERDRALWSAVKTLDERCRRLLRIIAFEERPDYARIAADLTMAVGSIGPTRRRCLTTLRATLERSERTGDGHGF